MSGQVFERLIRLEDEELGSNEDDLDNNNKDSCSVPMIPNSADSLENLFPGMKHKKQEHFKTTNNQSSSSLSAGISFTIKDRHIHINPEQLKYISLITLTIQNAALNLTMRAARTQVEQFSTPVAVTVAEFLKFITCLVLILFEEMSPQRAYKSIKTNIIDNYIDTLKVAVPSFVYYIQNNLLYVGSTHLDAATTQVTYQLKILTTAVFSVVMLNKKLSKIQWVSLITLFIGVAFIETMVVSDKSDKTHDNINKSIDVMDSSSDHIKNQNNADKKEQPLLGFLAILIACCLSGFAGVYFEKILKNTSHVSLWIRNIQLSIVAIPIGLLQVFIIDPKHVETKGFFYGFTPLTWFCIILQVQGGLLVAVVVKYANNILKGFATSMAIVISTVASMFLFNFNLTFSFMFGASLVVGSVMMYNKQ